MQTKIKIFTSTLIIALLSFYYTKAQTNYKLASDTELIVAGSSSLHDWTMTSTNATGKARIIAEDGKIKKINSLIVTLPVKTLKSGKSSMDKNAYEALKENDYKEIVFTLTGIDDISDKTIKARGNLTIAGATRPVSMEVHYNISGNTVQFSGNQEITFEEFKLEPPTAMFGTIKTGNELEISYKANFKL